MPTIDQFFEEINEIFGFYYDVSFATNTTLEKFETIQKEHGISNDSPFSYKSGPPVDLPEKEAKEALHTTTFGQIKERMKKNGFNQQKSAEAVLVLIYHIWDEKYRHKLIQRDGTKSSKINSDIIGDIRLIRNSIIHNKGIADKDISKCKIFKKFSPEEKIILHQTDIDFIILELRKDFYGL